jgi:SSS family solute:Na+ symporter
VIIGGLYWRRGTTRGAWVAAVTGVSMVLAGLFLQQARAGWDAHGVAFFGALDWMGANRAAGFAEWVHARLPNGQELWGWSMLVCTVLYILASFPWKPACDLDRLLHRDERTSPRPAHRAFSPARLIGITDEFTRRDRWLYAATILFNGFWILVLIAGSAYVAWHVHARGGSVRDLDPAWSVFWRWKVLIMLAVAAVVTVWFLVGGIRDVAGMLRTLRERTASDTDTGIVDEHEGR